jgi:uncharacterized protein DUF6457
MDADEQRWLSAVEQALGLAGPAIDDEVKRLLLRATKVTADATGVRYLAPLTAYLVGLAAGRAEGLDLRAAAEEISRLASGWPHAPDR